MINPANATVLKIDGPGDIRTVAEIHGRLLTAIKSGPPVVIDLHGVEEPDIALIQLLEAARHYAGSNKTMLELQEPADGFLRSLLERGGFLADAASSAFWLKAERGLPC